MAQSHAKKNEQPKDNNLVRIDSKKKDNDLKPRVGNIQRLNLTDTKQVRVFMQKILIDVANGNMDNTTARTMNDLCKSILDILKSEQEIDKLVEIEEKLLEVKNRANTNLDI